MSCHQAAQMWVSIAHTESQLASAAKVAARGYPEDHKVKAAMNRIAKIRKELTDQRNTLASHQSNCSNCAKEHAHV